MQMYSSSNENSEVNDCHYYKKDAIKYGLSQLEAMFYGVLLITTVMKIV